MPITFKMLLNAEKIDPREVRLVRYHYTRSNRKVTPYRLWRRGGALLEQYQRIQAKEVFKVGDILASFVRTPNGKTLFVGLYRVNSQGIADESDIDPSTGLCTPGRIKYDISKDDRLKDMQGRLVVDWGKGFLAWVQHADRNDKDVVELLRSPEDEPFPGYFRFRWSLKEVGDLPQAWAQRLREATGVYLLSAFGEHRSFPIPSI